MALKIKIDKKKRVPFMRSDRSGLGNRFVTPLNSTFMLTSILGFVCSALLIPEFSNVIPNALSYAIAFSLVFILMFVASLISMGRADMIDGLQIDERRRIKFR
jgi:hypothetical protein